MRERLSRFVRGFAARQEARDRLPGWLKAIMLPTIFFSWFVSMALLIFVGLAVHEWLHPRSRAPEGMVALLFFASFATGVVPAFVLANYLLWIIPPIRRALDKNARGVPGASFQAANRALLRVARFSVPISFLIWIAAAVDPWH